MSDLPQPYLIRLTLKLSAGLERLSVADRQRHSNFFLSQQQSDGGFCGRSGGSDLYYTAFALRGLAILGYEERPPLSKAADYLRSQLRASVSIIDLISLVFAAKLLETWTGINTLDAATSDWRVSVANLFEQLRRDDGGYAKTSEGHASSTYQTFLISLAYELLELPLPQPQAAINFLLGQQRDDGGFVEIGVMRRSGTNPTAAAIGGLLVLQARVESSPITEPLRQDVSEFLLENLTEENGLRANTQIPIADLLSTFTGLQTIRDLGAWDQVDVEAIHDYVRSLKQPNGGFFAAAWDEVADVEYSFYGVALQGLLLSSA